MCWLTELSKCKDGGPVTEKLVIDFDILMTRVTEEKEKTIITCPEYDFYTNPNSPNNRGLAISISVQGRG